MSKDSFEKFEELLADYEDARETFNLFSRGGEDNKEVLLEFQLRFVNLKADLRPIHKYIAGQYTRRDDKAATAIKYRIATSIANGEFVGEDGKLVYDKCSMAQAEKLAASSQKYKEFLSQRALYKESLINISDIREDIANYITLIRDRINKIM